MTEQEMRDIARSNVEAYIGDVCDSDDPSDTIREEAFTLAIDALLDAGVDPLTASPIAMEVANDFAPMEEDADA